MPRDRDDRDRLMRLKSSLIRERSSFMSHWRELDEGIAPRRGRFLITDRNKGGKRHQKIINSEATYSWNVAKSGIFAGIMSPARPWFNLGTFEEDLNKFNPVRDWFYRVETMMRDIFMGSNLYNMAPNLLGQTILFATGAMSHLEHPSKLARFFAHPIGSYGIAQDENYIVNTFVREFEHTPEQLIGQFGLENVSVQVKRAYEFGNYDQVFPVVHVIEPNENVRDGSANPKFRPFRSHYFEPAAEKDTFLEQKGFFEFPVYVPRWETTGEDTYGTNCPGMASLGDTASLQVAERKKAQAVEKMVSPVLSGPSSLKNVPVANLPGGLTIYDGDQQNKLGPVYQVDPRVVELREDIRAIGERIHQNFFVDLFMAISTMQGVQPKNQLELNHRDQERLLQLGPVLEQLHGAFLEPLIDRTFNQMVRRDILPEPPPELEGMPLKVKFVSTLAMAQRSVEVARIENFSLFVREVAQDQPNVRDNYDGDEAVRQYAYLTGTVPSVLHDEADVVADREARQQAEEEARQLQQEQEAAKTANQGAAAIHSLSQAEATAQAVPA